MFLANTTPLNWHQSMKKLRKDAQLGHSEHSLNHLIVKRRPQSLYIAHAIRDITAVVDKKHKDVPGVKEAVKAAGASSDAATGAVAEGKPVEAPTAPPARAASPPREASPTHKATRVLFDNGAGTGLKPYSPPRGKLPAADADDEAPPAPPAPPRAQTRPRARTKSSSESDTEVPARAPSRKRRGIVSTIADGVGNAVRGVGSAVSTVAHVAHRGLQVANAVHDYTLAPHRLLADGVEYVGRRVYKAATEAAKQKDEEDKHKTAADAAKYKEEEEKQNAEKAALAKALTAMTYQQFQKANKGKGLSSKAMGAAWAQYKANSHK